MKAAHNLNTHIPEFPALSAVPSYDELADRFRPIFQRIAKDALRREHARELPFEAVGWLREAGFGALRVPRSHGGSGATLPQLFRLLIELAEADSNLSQILRAHFAFVEGRLSNPDQAAHEFWFPKLAEGMLFGAAMSERTEATGGNTTLSKDGEQWVLNGQKYYCTGTIYADWIAASAQEGEDRVSIAIPTSLPGVVREDDWDGFGQRLTGSGTTRFHAVPIAREHIMRRFSDSDDHFDSYIRAFYQLVLLSTLAGIGRAVVRDGTEFVQGRTRAFGVPGVSSPRTDPLVQRVIGKLSSLSFAADSIVDAAATALEELYQARRDQSADEALHVATEIKAFQAQQTVIDLVLQTTTLLFEVGGASATSQTRSFDRHWRNARTVSSHNPAIYRERAIGDYLLNGTVPDAVWRTALSKHLSATKQTAETSESRATPDPAANAGQGAFPAQLT